MLTDTNMIVIPEGVGYHFFQLLPIHKGAVSTALVAQYILSVFIVNSRMTARGELIFREQNIASGCAPNAHLKLIQRILLQNCAAVGPQDQVSGVFNFVHGSLSCWR